VYFNDLCAGISQRNVFKKPIIVYAYPKDFKAFYMGLNDDGKAVAAMDMLVAKVINHFYVKILPLMSLVRGRYMCFLVVMLYEGIS
jgi:hypothetical protein